MSVIEQLASKQNRRDEIPNQLLAKHLVQTRDTEGIAEIARYVWDRDTAIQNDCIKVLYEIGCLAPDLIAPYTKDFLKLLSSKHNRLVWGAMLALSTVATIQADFLFEYVAEIQQAIADGSVITVDNGMKVLSTIAAARPEYAMQLFPLSLSGIYAPAGLKKFRSTVKRFLQPLHLTINPNLSNRFRGG